MVSGKRSQKASSKLSINWRHGLLLWCVLGMDLSWLVPWTVLLTGTISDPSHGVLLIWLPALLVGALAVNDMLGRSPLSLRTQELLASLLAVLSGLLLIWVYLYADYPLLGSGWLLAWLRDLVSVRGYGWPGVVLLAVAVYAWWRSLSLLQSRLSAETVGFYLRVGIVAWFLFHLAGLYVGIAEPVGWLFLFFSLGLVAVGLARVQEMLGERGAIRSPFTASWLLIMAGSALGVGGLALAAAAVLSSGVAAAVWRLLTPLWSLVQWLLYSLVLLLSMILAPLLEWLLGRILPQSGLLQITPVPVPTVEVGQQPPSPPAWFPPLRTAFWLLAGLAALAVIVLMMLGLRRPRERAADPGAERETDWERSTGEPDEGLGPRLRRLGDRLIAALRPAGPPSFSLATAPEIYASLLGLAAWKGIAREDAETPYEYRRKLEGAWPNAEHEVATITDAYVRAHYGQREIDEAELERLRAGWQRLEEKLEQAGHGGPGAP